MNGESLEKQADALQRELNKADSPMEVHAASTLLQHVLDKMTGHMEDSPKTYEGRCAVCGNPVGWIRKDRPRVTCSPECLRALSARRGKL